VVDVPSDDVVAIFFGTEITLEKAKFPVDT
jgi:hypothetical protein